MHFISVPFTRVIYNRMGKTVATTATVTEKETETATSTWTTQNSLRKGWRRNKVDGEKEKVLEECTACTSKIVILLSCWMNTAVKTGSLYLTEKCEYMCTMYMCTMYMCMMYIWVRCIPISAFSCYLSCKIVSILSLISKYEWFKNKNVTICG